MVGLTAATAAPDQIAYMDAAASTAVGIDYKQRFVASLDLRPGQTVVDVGCGPGTDLARLADAVGEEGSVLGVDRETRMLEEARRRMADRPNVELLIGDVLDLPIPDDGVDRARTDRVLQQVTDPARAVEEARRALRPGGLFGMAEPDWDTLAVADRVLRMTDVNGIACSIEMYVGRDVLEDENENLPPVELKGFIHGVERRQGVVTTKETLQREFRRKADAALSARAARRSHLAVELPPTEGWADLDSIIRKIIEAHEGH